MLDPKESFSTGELRLIFTRFEEKLDDLRESLKTAQSNWENRIKDVENDVADLKTFQTRAMVVWSVIVTAAGFLIQQVAQYLHN